MIHSDLERMPLRVQERDPDLVIRLESHRERVAALLVAVRRTGLAALSPCTIISMADLAVSADVPDSIVRYALSEVARRQGEEARAREEAYRSWLDALGL